MRRLLPAILAAAAVAACGCGEERNDEAAAPAETTRLTIEVTGAGPDPIKFGCGAADCDLGELAQVTEPPDPQQACTLQYGGPEQAHVTGTLEGEPVDVTIDRADGCGISAYDKLFAALGRRPPLAG